MAEIRVRVVAAADVASFTRVFNSIGNVTDKAYAKVTGSAKRASKESTAAIQAGVAEQARAMGSPYRTSGRVRDDDVRMTAKAEAAKTREIERHEQIRRRIRDTTFRQMQRDDETQSRRMRAPMRDFGRDVSRTSIAGARVVFGAAGEALRGAGLDASLGGLAQRVVGLESSAIRATSAGKMGAGKVATGADVASTQAAIKSAGDATSMDYGAMGAALEAFTAKSSDLEGGKRVLADIGAVASATGSDLAELAAGAGAVSQNMTGYGDSSAEAARKAGDLMKIVRLMAKQGSMGSVEIKDLATYMPRLAANANKFTGSYEENIGQLGAIAQMSMKGGRSTAAEATNSAAAFARDLSKPQNIKRLEGAGIGVFADAGKTKMRSASDIITDVFAKTKGDQSQISSMFRNEMSRSAINAFSGTYSDAGGGEAGLKAIKDAFSTFTKTISAGDVQAASALTQDSKAGRIQAAQNRATEMMGEALVRVVPSLEKLAPVASKVASGLSKIAVYVAENPVAALMAVITLSIAKANIGAIIARAISGGGGGVGGFGGGGMGGPKAFGSGALGAAAPTAAMIGVTAFADQLEKLLTTELPESEAQREGGIQSAIESAMRRGDKSVEYEGETISVKGRARGQAADGQDGKWLYEREGAILKDHGARTSETMRKKMKDTSDALTLWKEQFDIKDEQYNNVQSGMKARTTSQVGSAQWYTANVQGGAQGFTNKSQDFGPGSTFKFASKAGDKDRMGADQIVAAIQANKPRDTQQVTVMNWDAMPKQPAPLPPRGDDPT